MMVLISMLLNYSDYALLKNKIFKLIKVFNNFFYLFLIKIY